MKEYDFSGWATRNNVKCSDGRTIMKDAFKHCDGKTVPLVWMHSHNNPLNVLGHALLENRDEGVYAYCSFNDTEQGISAKKQVQHGDIKALSIYANKLKEQNRNVYHGEIRELSLVLAGANPEAFIEEVVCHSDESTGEDIMEEAIMFFDENICLEHADDSDDTKQEGEEETVTEEEKLEHADNAEEEKKVEKSEDEETVADVFETLTEKQKTVVYALIGQALEDAENEKEPKGGKEEMKHNVFDQETENTNVLTHADEAAIIELAKKPGVGSLKTAMEMYAAENDSLAHAFDNDTIEALFPDYKDVKPGAPEVLKNDLGWVSKVIAGVHKSPISRIRTRQIDAKGKALRGKGYKKGEEKTLVGNVKLLSRTTDPQTIYVKDQLNRDDIIDITDFDVVAYQHALLKDGLHEEIATAILFGDQREEGDENKIYEDKVRPIWTDDELYTIHYAVDMEAMRNSLQGSNTVANFSENYIQAEAFVQASLYSREQYKGSGNLDMYVTPHQLNVMMLSRDINGRRIYQSVTDLAAALNVRNIITVEQMEGLTRVDAEGKTKKLLALFVNLNDYHVGATKGGQITNFEDFDIDFNQYKYLMETRMSGALVRVKSAIALEEEVTA